MFKEQGKKIKPFVLHNMTFAWDFLHLHVSCLVMMLNFPDVHVLLLTTFLMTTAI